MIPDYLKIKEAWDEYREATDTACKAAKAAAEAQERAAKASDALKAMIPIGHACAIGDVVLTSVDGGASVDGTNRRVAQIVGWHKSSGGTNRRVLRVLDRIPRIAPS